MESVFSCLETTSGTWVETAATDWTRFPIQMWVNAHHAVGVWAVNHDDKWHNYM